MDPIINLYGMRIKLSGDLDEARRRVHLANQLRFKTQMVNVNDLDIVQNFARLDDGTQVRYMGQHGLDIAEIYVPPRPTVQVPRKQKLQRQALYPAFEVYDDASYQGAFVGVVLCFGGGFEPPYKFVAKDALLPDDKNGDAPAEPLPKQRIWRSPVGKEIGVYEDVAPLGYRDVIHTTNEQPDADYTFDGDYKGVHSSSCMHEEGTSYLTRDNYRLVYETYLIKTVPYYEGERTEYRNHYSSFTFFLPGEDNEQEWDEYEHEGYDVSGGLKPGHYLSYVPEFKLVTEGEGWFKHHIIGYPPPSGWGAYTEDAVIGHWSLTGGWFERDESRSLDLAVEERRTLAEGNPDPYPWMYSEDRYDSRDSIYGRNACYYEWAEERFEPYREFGSVAEADKYSLAYSVINKKTEGFNKNVPSVDVTAEKKNTFCNSSLISFYCTPHAGSTHTEDEDDNPDEEGPLYVVVSGEEWEVLPAVSADNPTSRLIDAIVKYFEIGDKQIGLFRIKHGASSPYDYKYIYAEAREDLIITPAGTDYYWQVPEVTDYSGGALYAKGGMRLIRETVTYEEGL